MRYADLWNVSQGIRIQGVPRDIRKDAHWLEAGESVTYSTGWVSEKKDEDVYPPDVLLRFSWQRRPLEFFMGPGEAHRRDWVKHSLRAREVALYRLYNNLQTVQGHNVIWKP